MPAPRFAPWFWPLIESFGGKKSAMKRAFEAMPKARMVSFYRQVHEASDAVNPCYCPEIRANLVEDCSEDHAKDFALWVVAQGRAFYHQMRKNPETVQEHLERFGRNETRIVLPTGVAWLVFWERFGQSFAEAAYDERGWPRRRRKR